MIFLALTVISLILVWIIGRIFKKNLIPEIVLGLLIGLSWEITTAPMWNYNTNVLTVFYIESQEISLDVIFLWGVTLTVSSLVIIFMQKRIFKKTNYKTFLLSTIIVFVIVGWLIEYIGSTYGFWTYLWDYRMYLFDTPVITLYGWCFCGILYMSTIKFLRKGLR